MRSLPRARSGPAAMWVTIDLVRSAWRTRNLFGLLVVVTVLLAAALALAVKVVLPWAVYPAL